MFKMNYLIFLLLSPFYLFAENKYTIGVQSFKHFPPYSAFENNNYTGFNRKLLDMFADSQGFKFEYKARPIKRLYAEFLNQQYDFKYPDNEVWSADLKKKHKIYYSEALVNYIDGLIVKKENKGKPFSEIKKITTINGFTPQKRYQIAQQKEQLKIITVRDYQHLLDLVIEDRVDGAYFDINIAEQHITNARGKERSLVFDENLPFIKGKRRLSSIKHPDIILLFNQFLIDYKSQIDDLKRQYNILYDKKIQH